MTKDTFDRLEWEGLIKILKKETENIDKLPKATASNLTYQDFWNASFIFYVFQSIYEKYQKNDMPFK